MIWKLCCGLALLFCTTTTKAQTLFTYGKNAVDAKEFLSAYKKNNIAGPGNKAKQIANYLTLYINSKLKVQEAYEKKIDTLPQIQDELKSLRQQIIQSYVSDAQTNNRLIKEALDRSQKDVRVGHIFIAADSGAAGAMAAEARIQQIQAKLKKGEDFLTLTKQLSQTTAAGASDGDLGWFTVFGLPYAIETVVYNLPKGKYSEIVKGKTGFHIFKKLDERKAVGKMKASQILLAFPKDADENYKNEMAQKADSIYKLIKAGEDFGVLAKAFSNDYLTASNNGSIPDFGVGRYNPVFEKNVWALQQDGEVTKPFLTELGYHIVKRNGIVPVIADSTDEKNKEILLSRINQEQRWMDERNSLSKRILAEAGFQKIDYNEAALWAYTDSLVERQKLGDAPKISPTQNLFTIGTLAFSVTKWIDYIKQNRLKINRGVAAKYGEAMKGFINASTYEYYKNNLEQYDKDFSRQMQEFKEGNLFFEIMQQNVWNKGSDDATLKKIYNTNKRKYQWRSSADAVLFHVSDKEAAKQIYDSLKRNPDNWRNYEEQYAQKLTTDSGRIELSQLPGNTKTILKEKTLTAPTFLAESQTTSFAYILKLYSGNMPKSFEEARGMLISDYQDQIEAAWVQTLRKKYPVKINEKVLAAVSK